MEGEYADIDERARNTFVIGGTAVEAWHDSRTRVVLGMVINFLAARSPLSVVVHGGLHKHIVEVSIQALNGSCKTTLNLPSLLCSGADEEGELPAVTANVSVLRNGDLCFACQLPLIPFNATGVVGQRVVYRPCGALYHATCYSSVLHEPGHASCPACPSVEKRVELSRSFGMSFIFMCAFYDWLEMHLPADFCANTFIPTMCSLCGLSIIKGPVSRPFPCDCFAHNSCTLLASAEENGLRTCPGCRAMAPMRLYPSAIQLYHPSKVAVGASYVSADYMVN
jgi:hypothetical protein